MCGRLVNLDTVARVLAEYYHLKTETQLAALDEALSRVPAETVGKELFGNSEQLELDTISRAAVVDAIEGVDWYHINKNGEMVHGANPDDHQAWYKAEDIYKAVENVPSAQPEIIYCKDCVKHNKGHGYYLDGTVIGIKDCCPLVEIRGMSQGHEFDYQYCAYAERRTDGRPD